MLKNILNLNGALTLTSAEQKEINGGKTPSTGCMVGGTVMSINSCLCNGGLYSATTQTCVSGTATGNLYENATGCCYKSFNGEF